MEYTPLCKAAVKTSPTNQHSVFTGRMPFLSPNQSVKAKLCRHSSLQKNPEETFWYWLTQVHLQKMADGGKSVKLSWNGQLVCLSCGTGIRGLDERLGNPPEGDQEPSVVKTQMEDFQVNSAWAVLWNVVIFLFSAPTVGGVTGRAPGL